MSTKEKEAVLDAKFVSSDKEKPIESNGNGKPKDEPEAPPKERSRVPIYVVCAIIFISAVGGLGWWLYARQFVTTDDAHIQGHISVISPKISSHVSKIHVKENQFVKKGDLLVEFEAQEQLAKLEEAKAQLQAALARREKAEANLAFSRKTGHADLSQAASNLETAKANIEQTQIATSSKQNVIEQARSRVSTAEANLRQAQALISAAEAAVAQAKAQVPVAKNKLQIARLEHDRDRQLFDAGDVARRQLEQSGKEMSVAEGELTAAEKQVEIAESRLSVAHRQVESERSRLNEVKAGVAAAENDYRQLQAQVGLVTSQADESAGRLQEAKTLPERVAVEQSEVATAEAEIAKAQAAVNQAEIEFSHTKIFAPQDGFVVHRAVQEGQLVQPEQRLMAITQSELWVSANFKETQIERLKIGQRVDIYVDAYPSATFRGRVESFQAGTGSRFNLLPAENASGNFVKVVQRIPVKIVFDEMPDDKKYLLVPGMSVVPKVHVR